MTQLDALIQEVLPALERFVKFKIHHRQDAEDIIQEVCLTAANRFDTLRDPAAFKPWILRIAGNKCTDYYRARAKQMQISLDALSESALVAGRMGPTVQNVVRETLDALGDRDKQILYLWFFKNYTGEEIAKHLSLPVGTVKSRLHYAKEKFRLQYPYPPNQKGKNDMSNLPQILPAYTITPSTLPPFPVRWEELQGWMLVPRLGEALSWGLYDASSRARTEYTEMKVLGKAEVHGIEGVEISAIQYDAEDYYRTGSVNEMERRFVAQLTDTHCRYLAESHVENGVRKLYTFLDGDDFTENWGFGEDNCGNEVYLSQKGLLHRDGNTVTGNTPKEVVDVAGRYTVTIDGKSYDTICVMDIQCFNDGVASEQYLDQNGRTVLWRRFNKNDWAFHRYGKLWSEMLPENERLTINGETYVHWYDCVSDYVLH